MRYEAVIEFFVTGHWNQNESCGHKHKSRQAALECGRRLFNRIYQRDEDAIACGGEVSTPHRVETITS